MKITNKLKLPEGLVKAVSMERHNKKGCISATTLIQGVKQTILTERHWDELEDDVSDRLWAIWGTAVHSLLEHEGETDFTELDMCHIVGGITITGRIDNYDMQKGIICDYKTASVYKVKFKDFSDWKKQGMIYAWLLSKNGFAVHKCRFIALLKDHSKTDAMRDYQYPQNPVYVYEFPVSSMELLKIDVFIRQRVQECEDYSSMKDDEIPPCSSEERWEKQPKYAVMKNGLKRAVRLFDEKEPAQLLASEKGEGHFVEFRQGESIKCRSYCLCNRFCNFYQESLMGAEKEPAEEQAA